MNTLAPSRAAAVRLAVQGAAAAVAAKMGFDFGLLLGGAPMGCLMGANAAIFAWLMAAAALDAVFRFTRR